MAPSQVQDNMDKSQLETSHEGREGPQEGSAGGPGEEGAGRTQTEGTPPTPLGTPVRVENLATRVRRPVLPPWPT